MVGELRNPGHDLVRVGREKMAGDDVCEALEPEGAQLREHGTLVRHGLPEDDVECADAIARHQQERVSVDLVDFAHFTAAQEREGQRARDERSRHTLTSAAAAAGATASMR